VNSSPEARAFTRYAVMAVLAVIALFIGSRSYAGVVFGWILAGASLIGTRIVYAAPLRFTHRNATRRLRNVWYLFVAEIVAAATAFTLVFDQRGSPAAAIAALGVVILLEVVATTIQRAEYVRLNVIVAPIRQAVPDDVLAFSGEAGGPANQAFKSALADVFPRVPTVVRAYLVTSADEAVGGRVLALRFAYPWVDEDGVRAGRNVFRRMFPSGERLEVIGLDERSEVRLREIASAFYERPRRTIEPSDKAAAEEGG